MRKVKSVIFWTKMWGLFYRYCYSRNTQRYLLVYQVVMWGVWLCFKTSDISLIRWDLDAAIGAYNQPLLEWKDNDLFCSWRVGDTDLSLEVWGWLGGESHSSWGGSHWGGSGSINLKPPPTIPILPTSNGIMGRVTSHLGGLVETGESEGHQQRLCILPDFQPTSSPAHPLYQI